MNERIIRVVIKELYHNHPGDDPLHCIYALVEYRSGKVSQRRYRKLSELPLSVRDYLTEEHYTSEHELDMPGKMYRMHITEYKGV